MTGVRIKNLATHESPYIPLSGTEYDDVHVAQQSSFCAGGLGCSGSRGRNYALGQNGRGRPIFYHPASKGGRCSVSWKSSANTKLRGGTGARSEEHTSELQSLMRISYAVFCLKKKKIHKIRITNTRQTPT